MSQLIAISGCDNPNSRADVVFVHGLGGDAHETWRYGKDDSSSWPHWLGEDFPEIGVWSLDYASSPTRWISRLVNFVSKKAGHTMALPDRAEEVLALLVQKGLGQRPLMFICHSMGGLLVKQLLRKANDKKDNSSPQKVVHQTKAVLFLATPHMGSLLASLVDMLRGIFGSTESIKELRKDDSHLRDLHDWYRNHAQSHGIETVTYFETKPVKGILSIVNPSSAHSGVGCDPIPLDEDHISISRPRDREAQVYCAAQNLLQKHVFFVKDQVATNSLSRVQGDWEDTSPEDKSKLIGTNYLLASALNEFLTPRDAQFNSTEERCAETPSVLIKGQGMRDDFLLKQIYQQDADGFSDGALSVSQKRVIYAEVAKIINKLNTTDDIEAEIRSQLFVWNYDKALLLASQLGEHLEGIDQKFNLLLRKVPQHLASP